MTNEEIRVKALEAAVRIYAESNAPSYTVILMAKDFEKYIRGTA